MLTPVGATRRKEGEKAKGGKGERGNRKEEGSLVCLLLILPLGRRRVGYRLTDDCYGRPLCRLPLSSHPPHTRRPTAGCAAGNSDSTCSFWALPWSWGCLSFGERSSCCSWFLSPSCRSPMHACGSTPIWKDSCARIPVPPRSAARSPDSVSCLTA